MHAFEIYNKVQREQLLNAHLCISDGMPNNRPILSMNHEKTDKKQNAFDSAH